ncbi:MAG: YgjP-like metallopeptidase domain-containing protein [Propionibacteriaceae bacterium]
MSDVTPTVEIRRSKRRVRTIQAHRSGNTIIVQVPAGIAALEEEKLVANIVAKLLAREANQLADSDENNLLRRAKQLNKTVVALQAGYLILPNEVKWVTNQSSRWGSCTHTTKVIRLSHHLRSMPQWVVDYVICHELAHLYEPSHSAAFWELLRQVPQREKARGYLAGWAAAARLEISDS